ncbi:MAG TPA: hypothetical protein VI957_00950 [Candidatus Paceibacterota bacterium]
MHRTIFLIGIAILALVVFILQTYALDLYLYLYLYLYWTFWWFDILMHGLGGALIGALALWFFVFEFRGRLDRLLLLSLGSVLVVGILWEIFEKVIGWQVDRSLADYVLDTAGDLTMDIIGAFAAYLLCSRIWSR